MKPMFVTMIRLKQPSIQSIFTRNERCGDCRTFALRSSWVDRLGAIDVAGAVAPTPTNIWEPIAKRQATQISTERWAFVSSNTERGFLQKMAAVKVKATLEQDVLLETSARCIRCLAGSLFQ